MSDCCHITNPGRKNALSGPDNHSTPISLGLVQIHAPLARGGMAQLYRGTHSTWGGPVAVKVLPREHVGDYRYLNAFKTELMALTRLNHPGVVKLLDWGKTSRRAEALSKGVLVAGQPYLALEYLGAGSLADRPLPRDWSDLETILRAILSTLSFIHRYHIVHRDISLSNLLCGNDERNCGFPKLIDFGLARVSGSEGVASQELNAGTPAFQAPEVILPSDRLPQGPWTDLYSFGCVAYYLASGALPFDADSPAEMDLLHLGQQVPPLRSKIPLPEGFESWVVRLLAKSPELRPQNAAEAARALQSLKASPQSLRGPDTNPRAVQYMGRTASKSPTVAPPEGLSRRGAANTAVETPTNGLPKIRANKGRVSF